jgi:4-aminobutyrate aminotransferase-like enzyme
MGEKAKSYLQEKLAHAPSLRSIRGRGLMLALEFREAGKGAKLMDDLRKDGLIILPSGARGECLSITPALTIEWKELQAGLDLIIAAVSH